MDKHPVSRLQEKMAKSHKALPTYMMQQVGNMFVYTVKVDGITVLGTGYSMSTAKYDAADRALSRLVDDEPQPPATNLPSVSGENYIGALNELVSKYKQPLPVYSVLNMNNMFSVKCKLLRHSTEGYASIQKQAKQHAAREMLIVLNAGLTDLLKQRANIESTIEQFENKTNLFSGLASSSDEEMSTKYMWSELQKYVSLPLLQTIQTYPCYILSLNIDDDCKRSIMEMGKTYEETYRNLLKKALILVKLS